MALRYAIRGGRASGLRLVVLVVHRGLYPVSRPCLLAVLRAVVSGRVRVVGLLVRNPGAVRLAPMAMPPGGDSRSVAAEAEHLSRRLLVCWLGWLLVRPGG
jgi:hypothetical protein